MRRVMGISGLGEGAGVSPATAAVGWTIVIGTVVLVFAGTLLLKPGKG